MKRTPVNIGKIALFPLIALAILWLAGPLQAKEIYNWTDENGVPHFSDLPPQGHVSRSLEIPNPVAMETGASADEPETNPAGEPPAQDDLCSQHQSRLDTMLANRNVSYIDESGERRDLSDEQYDDLVQESRTYLELHCDQTD